MISERKTARPWHSTLPTSVVGSAALIRFQVSDSESKFSGIRGEYVPAGEYTRLEIDGRLMMSDTPNELSMHCGFLRAANGTVLINGLGMGCCLSEVLNKGCVTSVTVIEKNPDVVSLVGPHFPEAEIICADAFDWKPPRGVRYGAVWHDIWFDICTDNLPDMHRLHRKYGRRTDWQGSWSRGQLERNRR